MNHNDPIELANQIDIALPPTPHLDDDARENHCNALAAYLIEHDLSMNCDNLLAATIASLR